MMVGSIAAAVLIVGLALLAFGLRGRRVDDHPICRSGVGLLRLRRCGYDLSGAAAPPERCPECGAVLAGRRRRVRLGNRRRRPLVATLGGLLVLAGLATGGVWGYNESRDFDWNTIKPVWWLKREAASTTDPNAPGARRELLARLQKDRLTTEQALAIAEIGLVMQADPNTPWDTTWGDFVETTWERGELPQEQLARYLHNALSLNSFVSVRPTIRTGGVLPTRTGMGTARPGEEPLRLARSGPLTGRSAAMAATYTLRLFENGRELPLKRQKRGFQEMTNLRFMQREGSLDVILQPGDHTLEFVFDCVGRRDADAGVEMQFGLSENAQDIAHWQMRKTATVTVLPDDESPVTMVDEPLMANDVRASIIRVEFVETEVEFGQRWFRTSNGGIFVRMPPMDLSFDVFARTGDREEKVGTLKARAMEDLTNGLERPRHPRDLFPEAEFCDIILRASPEAAERTIDIIEVWDGEIVIENVRIRPPEAGAAVSPGGERNEPRP